MHASATENVKNTYDPTNQGRVVVVTFNYRVGIEGFAQMLVARKP